MLLDHREHFEVEKVPADDLSAVRKLCKVKYKLPSLTKRQHRFTGFVKPPSSQIIPELTNTKTIYIPIPKQKLLQEPEKQSPLV